jgi:hypothetical protein
MAFAALHRFRRRSRGIAAATVAVFALNWLGLALVPCAMAFAAPATAQAAQAAPDEVAGTADVQAMPPDCHAHRGTVDTASTPAASPGGGHASCPWCLERGTAPAGAHDDAGCGAVAKPAVDSRDAKASHAPLLVALSATVLAIVPPDVLAPVVAAADPALPPDTPAADRYCRRLE